MASWPVQDAKARFSELLRASLQKGPQVVTLRGTDAAVLVPIAEWNRLQGRARRSLKEVLLDPQAKLQIPLPPRGHRRRRTGSEKTK